MKLPLGAQLPQPFVHFDWDGHQTTYRQAKNIYGMLMARSTYEGTKELMHGNRPCPHSFGLCRNAALYFSIWTGDIKPTTITCYSESDW